MPEPSPDDIIHLSHAAVLTTGAVLASARRSRAAAAKAGHHPQPDRKLDAPVAAPILHIRSEEELARARRKTARAVTMPSPFLLSIALALVIAIAVCGTLLVRIWRRARP